MTARPDLEGIRDSFRAGFTDAYWLAKIHAVVAYALQLEQDVAGARSSRELFVELTKYLHHGPGCDSMATLPGDCACGLRGRLQAALESRR